MHAAHTRQPGTAGALQGCLLRFERAVHLGAACGFSVVLRNAVAEAIQNNPDLLFRRNFRRVLRLISLTCLSADPFGPVLVLISYPFKDYDEPKTLSKQNHPVCLKGRDGLHHKNTARFGWHICPCAGVEL